MFIDANLLIYAVDSTIRYNTAASPGATAMALGVRFTASLRCSPGAATPCVESPAPSNAPTIKANLNFCFIRYLLLTPGNFSSV